MIREYITNESCSACRKEFKKVLETWPSKLEDRRTLSYYCPYCGHEAGSVLLSGNEDIKVYEIEEK